LKKYFYFKGIALKKRLSGCSLREALKVPSLQRYDYLLK